MYSQSILNAIAYVKMLNVRFHICLSVKIKDGGISDSYKRCWNIFTYGFHINLTSHLIEYISFERKYLYVVSIYDITLFSCSWVKIELLLFQIEEAELDEFELLEQYADDNASFLSNVSAVNRVLNQHKVIYGDLIILNSAY